VHGSWGVLVVVLDDGVEELGELGVGVVGSGIDADSGVLVGNTGEHTHLEWYTLCAALVLILFPNFLGQALLAFRFGIWEEEFVVVHQLRAVGISVMELVLSFLGGLRNS